MGHVSDPYKEGDGEGELAITGLPDELDSDVDGAGDDVDDEQVDQLDDVDDEQEDDEPEDDEGLDDLEALDGIDEEVAYDLEDFDDDQLDQLFDALDDAVIPYLWDGEELFVQAVDEPAVDELLDRIANPNEIAAEDGDGDGGGWLLGELFVTADRLQRDPDEHETVASMLQLANASDEAGPPYGLGEPEWEQLRERVTALAAILEQDEPDLDDTVEAARDLRNAVRPYV